MQSIYELGEPTDLHQEIEAFKSKTPAAKRSALLGWKNTQWGDSEAKTLTINLAAAGEWSALGSLWGNGSIRNVLWLVVDDIERHACRREEIVGLKKGLPSELLKSEWDLALSFAFKQKSMELLNILLSKKAVPSIKMMEHLCCLYDKQPGYFYRDAIQAIAKIIPWRQYLGFPDYADWKELVERGLKNESPALLVVASAFMSEAQKAVMLTGMFDANATSKIISHIEISKATLAKLSNQIKKQYLMNNLSL